MNLADNQFVILNGRWRLDDVNNQLVDLRNNGTAVILSPIAVRLLSILIDAPNTVVGRRYLFNEGWHRYGFEVCANSLNQVICALRNAFAQLGPHAPQIRTVPRIGYCLVAEVAGPAKAIQAVSPPLAAALCTTAERADSAHVVDYETFEAVVGREWRRAQRSGLPLSLLMVSHGVQARLDGDATAISAMIEDAVVSRIRRAGDLAARYPGAEYAVLLPDTDHQGAAHVARAIEQSVLGGNAHRLANAMLPSLAIGQACTAQRRYARPDEWIDAARSALQGALNGSPSRTASFLSKA